MDRVGRKPVMLGAVILYAVAGPAGLYVETLPQLLFARALLGIAIGGSMTAVITLVGDYFSGDKRTRVMGAQSAALEFGAVAFTLIAGALAVYGWRTPFLIYLLTIPLIPLVYFVINEPELSSNPGKNGSASKNSKEGFPVTALLAYAIGAIGMSGLFLLPVHLPFLIANKLATPNPFLISVAISVSTLFAGISATLYHRIKTRVSIRALFVPCFVLMAVGYAVFGFAQYYWMVLVGAAFAGAGIGIFLPNINMWVVTMAPPHMRGRVVSGLMSAVFLGQFSTPLLSTPIARSAGIDQMFFLASIAALGIAGAFAVAAMRAPDSAQQTSAPSGGGPNLNPKSPNTTTEKSSTAS